MVGFWYFFCFFFFKQKTAYEMRISDWSSDVCFPISDFADAVRREVPEGVDALLDTALLAETSFGAIRDGGVYLPVRGWGDKPAERGIEIRPVFVFEVLERTDWLELLRNMVAASEIKLRVAGRSEEHTSELQSLMRISYAVFCLKTHNTHHTDTTTHTHEKQ